MNVDAQLAALRLTDQRLQVAINILRKAGGSGGGGGVWGAITGTLSSQTDLQTALNAKAATSSLAAVATSGAYADLTGSPVTIIDGGSAASVLGAVGAVDGGGA